MKRLVSLTLTQAAVILIVTATFAFAQEFTFVCDNPVQPGNSGGENLFNALLTNNSSAGESFILELDDSQIGDWTYAWCVTSVGCFPPGVYSVTVPLEIGLDDTIQVHINPDSTTQDQGSITVTAYPESSPGTAISITFTAYFGTAVEPGSPRVEPHSFTLSSAYPNPFNPSTTFSYSLNEIANVRVSVVNLAGQEVNSLYEGNQSPGSYQLTWDGRDARGIDLPSALYFIRLNSDDQQIFRKALKLK